MKNTKLIDDKTDPHSNTSVFNWLYPYNHVIISGNIHNIISTIISHFTILIYNFFYHIPYNAKALQSTIQFKLHCVDLTP
jgi:hypothetical protein